MRSFSVLLALAASANALTVHEQFRRDVHDLEARQAQASLGDCTDICTPVIRNRHACANGPTTSESCADMCSESSLAQVTECQSCIAGGTFEEGIVTYVDTAISVVTAACSGSGSTESTAAPTTESTAAPTTESTAAPTTESTAAPTTESTAAPTTESTAAPTADSSPTVEAPASNSTANQSTAGASASSVRVSISASVSSQKPSATSSSATAASTSSSGAGKTGPVAAILAVFVGAAALAM